MARVAKKTGSPRSAGATRYDAHHTVLDKTYGAMADLRRELSDSKVAIAERTEILKSFSACVDPQRAWLILEDYFEKLSLSRKDFPSEEWWPRLVGAKGEARLEEVAMLFLKANRPLPSELISHANFDRFAELEQAEKENALVQRLERWLLPKEVSHLDSPRARVRVMCEAVVTAESPALHALRVELVLNRPRSGETVRSLEEIIELTTRAAHEQELFSTEDWEFITWLSDLYATRAADIGNISLSGLELVQWLTRWGNTRRLELADGSGRLEFHGELVDLKPHLLNHDIELSFTQQLALPAGQTLPLTEARFFFGAPSLVLVGTNFYLLRNAPSSALLGDWLKHPVLPVKKLTHRLLKHLRNTGSAQNNLLPWQELCDTHAAIPQFTFELSDDTVRLRLLAKSEKDGSVWQWSGHDWQPYGEHNRKGDKPELLDDPRLDPAVAWLRRLDWFTPEPGLWIGDANENFLHTLANAWPFKPEGAEFLGNPAFQRLFLAPRRLKPKLILHGSGIDWLSVSAEWEAEGMRLSKADLERLHAATGRFVKLPDSGWIELDTGAVQSAHEAMADFGLDGLNAMPQKVDILHASQASDTTMEFFANQPQLKALKQKLVDFKAVPEIDLPKSVVAELRPYQKEGFEFLAHLTNMKTGGILADDMGLGKTLQTLTWLAWLKDRSKKSKPAVVICPASVLHNWRREAEKFTPHMKVLVLESGNARHNLRKQIPQHDIIITNYALLRRDLEELQKFDFGAMVLDEAQFIKNPQAQITQSVKQLQAEQRLALTGTPLENRLLDLWSIMDFIQPGYLGTQADFVERYEPKGGESAEWSGKVARRRLAARLRPLMIRRVKKQVAKDLPDRIEERRDCDLGEAQRKLYLAELRRSREQVLKTVAEKGLAKSKIHVLAALTRLRQICCHPQLVGNDSASGKTETLFELIEPLVMQGQKVLVFSQFVQMLKLIEAECVNRHIATHLLTGETKDRQEVVNAFQADERGGLFLLSLRAAGTGLNLTTASYVVLYDPWWNPAVEAQAIDRSHRIGQTRNVFAYRLIAPGTVEEKIWDLQQRKAQTISDVLGEEGFARSLSQTDLEYLFSEE